jgi:hypothetical protein
MVAGKAEDSVCEDEASKQTAAAQMTTIYVSIAYQ